MIFVFLVLVAAVGYAVYLAVMYASIPGAVDERLGELEALPPNLGQWVADEESEGGRRQKALGRQREVRTLYISNEGWFGRKHFLIQTRTRDLVTGEVVEVEPEVRAQRRRIAAAPAIDKARI
ncbi:MAG TPA: hypothetical protein VHM70_17470 [Polyangiaceae bacterium]|jgi:hypothetical protein|nr:hypothetical protein [Polyangiaceae bacterium]